MHNVCPDLMDWLYLHIMLYCRTLQHKMKSNKNVNNCAFQYMWLKTSAPIFLRSLVIYYTYSLLIDLDPHYTLSIVSAHGTHNSNMLQHARDIFQTAAEYVATHFERITFSGEDEDRKVKCELQTEAQFNSGCLRLCQTDCLLLNACKSRQVQRNP